MTEAQIEIRVEDDDVPPPPRPTTVRKKFKDMTRDEYEKIEKDLVAGKEYEFYDIKRHKNGSHTICYKQNVRPTPQRVAAEKNIQKAAQTNEMNFAPFIGYLLDMNTRMTKYEMKRKYDKKRAADQAYYDHYYVDEDEITEKPGKKEDKPEGKTEEKPGTDKPAETNPNPARKPPKRF
jgi:hypothetical protein